MLIQCFRGAASKSLRFTSWSPQQSREKYAARPFSIREKHSRSLVQVISMEERSVGPEEFDIKMWVKTNAPDHENRCCLLELPVFPVSTVNVLFQLHFSYPSVGIWKRRAAHPCRARISKHAMRFHTFTYAYTVPGQKKLHP